MMGAWYNIIFKKVLLWLLLYISFIDISITKIINVCFFLILSYGCFPIIVTFWIWRNYLLYIYSDNNIRSHDIVLILGVTGECSKVIFMLLLIYEFVCFGLIKLWKEFFFVIPAFTNYGFQCFYVFLLCCWVQA